MHPAYIKLDYLLHMIKYYKILNSRSLKASFISSILISRPEVNLTFPVWISISASCTPSIFPNLFFEIFTHASQVNPLNLNFISIFLQPPLNEFLQTQ